MKILVTGGAGYIGSVVAHELIQAGDDVVVLDNLSQGHRAAVPAAAAFIEGDLADRQLIDELMATHQPEAIMHFASNTLVGESMQQPFLYLGDNLTNGLNLLQSAVQHGVGRFILSSTANLFDKPDEIPIKAEERIVPGSPYGESKFFLERLLYWMDRIHGMGYAALRYFNAAGAGSPDLGEDHHPETHLIPLVLQVALGQSEALTINGADYETPDGTCVRDYIHVLDLAQAHILALRALDQGSRVYNLGNGRGFSIQEVVDTARRVTGRSIPTRVGPRRPGDPAVLIADGEKIKQELGWQPRYAELSEIIGSAWQWHTRHPHGYEAD
jgi:UDP-glucose 4-epimerase